MTKAVERRHQTWNILPIDGEGFGGPSVLSLVVPSQQALVQVTLRAWALLLTLRKLTL